VEMYARETGLLFVACSKNRLVRFEKSPLADIVALYSFVLSKRKEVASMDLVK